LVDELRRELVRVPKNISIHGKRPDELSLGGKSLPLVPLAAICLLLSVVVVVVLYLLLSSSASSAVEVMGQIGRT
jgi:hypothetical protein